MSVFALAVTRRDNPSAPPEQEIVSVERHGDRLALILDDGEVLEMSADELHAASSPLRSGRLEAA